jgi:hypothetical protein
MSQEFRWMRNEASGRHTVFQKQEIIITSQLISFRKHKNFLMNTNLNFETFRRTLFHEKFLEKHLSSQTVA